MSNEIRNQCKMRVDYIKGAPKSAAKTYKNIKTIAIV